MTETQFETLVRTLEARAQRDPRGYQWKVVLLASLGSAYLFSMIVLILAAFAGSIALIWVFHGVALKLTVIVGAFLWIVVRALWVTISPPTGIEIKRREAPDLFEVIDELSAQLNAPGIHHLLISPDLNAGVVQLPRLGIFGWPRNFLLVGLPLMKSLTVEQFKAVLAHEFGHLAGGHGSLSNRIYRQRLRWARLLAVLEASKSKGSLLFKPFLAWFAPYFNAYTFPMARANEFQADASAARITSPPVAAQALTAVDVMGRFLGERYWPDIHKCAAAQAEPTGFAPFSNMSNCIARDLDRESATLWMSRAMTRETNLADTHPALRDRLNAIGQPPRLEPPAPGEAADRLLGPSLARITESLDHRWESAVAPLWVKHHQQVQQARQRLAELDARFESGAELALQDGIERALLTQAVGNRPDDSLAQLRALHQRASDSWEVCFHLGSCLLQRNDESGCALIERAMWLNRAAVTKGCELMQEYYSRNGREDEAQAWQKRLIEAAKVQSEALRERNRLSSDDVFEPHNLPEEAVADLRAQLQGIATAAHYVRKRVTHFPERPLYVLCVEASDSSRYNGEPPGPRALEGIRTSVRFPGETLIVYAKGSDDVLVAKIRYVEDARIL
jgi:Zn-dependent protease with chaperone function